MFGEQQQRIVRAFRDRFGYSPTLLAQAPGRVNLIGEHTDYSDGFVFPVAIDRTALVAAAPAKGSTSRLWAVDLREGAEFDPLRLQSSTVRPWSNYLRGVAWALGEAGHPMLPVDLAIQSSVPMGVGLSSSAALEVAATIAMVGIAGVALAPRETARIAHQAETGFVGVPCGIMDQYISALAIEDHALLIDCRSLEAEPVPLGLREQGVALVVVESGVSRELAHSAYQERRSEVAKAMELLLPWLPADARNLRDVTPEQLDSLSDRLPPRLLRRSRHVVTENRRVLRFADAVRNQQTAKAGALMGESHRSLRDDYEVSTPELDLLVELAYDTPGTFGARLTGAGFGGCTVNLVEWGSLETFQDRVVEEYRRRTGRPARSHCCRSTGGAALHPVPIP